MASTATVIPSDESKELAETLTESEVTADAVEDENAGEELSAADRFQQRLDRFGKIAPEAKKLSRALRFGTTHETLDDAAKKRRSERFGAASESAEDQQDKKRQRGERFHTNTPTAPVDEATKQKRIDRFGVVTPSTSPSKKNKANGQSASATPELTEAMKKRTERFGDVSEAAKANTMSEQKVKRAERFKPNTSA